MTKIYHKNSGFLPYILVVLTDVLCHVSSRYKVFLHDIIFYCNSFLHNILIYDLYIEIDIWNIPCGNMYISDYFGFFNYCMYFNGPTILKWFCHHILPKKRYAWTTNPHSYVNFDFRQYLQHMYLCALIRLSAVSLCTDNLTQPLFFSKKTSKFFKILLFSYHFRLYICMYIYAYKYIEEAM